MCSMKSVCVYFHWQCLRLALSLVCQFMRRIDSWQGGLTVGSTDQRDPCSLAVLQTYPREIGVQNSYVRAERGTGERHTRTLGTCAVRAQYYPLVLSWCDIRS